MSEIQSKMPSTSMALTPGLSSFLKSLKTNPIDTSIDNLISYDSNNISLATAMGFDSLTIPDSSNGDRSVTRDHAPLLRLTFSSESSLFTGQQMLQN